MGANHHLGYKTLTHQSSPRNHLGRLGLVGYLRRVVIKKITCINPTLN